MEEVCFSYMWYQDIGSQVDKDNQALAKAHAGNMPRVVLKLSLKMSGYLELFINYLLVIKFH